MAGARLLAPFFGASNLVWANIIGLILLYLSVGYWIGGRMADRHPHGRRLGLLVLGAAVTIASLPFISRPLFGTAAGAFDGLSAGAFIGSFLGTMALFAIPVTALGAISPWVIRLAVTDVEQSGAVVGRMYALSTLGSLVGTFLPVLVLIPLIGTQRTLIAIAAALALAAVPLVGRRGLIVPIALVALMAIPPGSTKQTSEGRVIFEGESPYQYVQVVERPNGTRLLHLNEGWAVHSILPVNGPLTGGYWDAFTTLPLLSGRPTGRYAVLGNAGGTIANLYAAVWPDATIDGVEIDPLVSDVGRRYLGMTNPRLTVSTADARVWLRGAATGYDGMVIDAYRQPYIPFHLVSREFFTEVRAHLSETGVIAINVGTPPGEYAAVDMIAATMRDVFPSVHQVRVDEFNSVIFGYARAADVTRARGALGSGPASIATISATVRRGLADVPPGGQVLTDDHAPIEWVTDGALIAYLRQGAPGADG
jgi:spermidine synthase